MNKLQYERSKLEVLQSSDIALGNDSIEIRELSDDKILVKVSYAERDFEVMIFLSSPLDFIIISKELLPMEHITTMNTDISLKSLLARLTSELKNYNMDQSQEFKDIIRNLCDNDVIEKDNFELLVEARQTTLYLKFPVKNIQLASLTESIESDKLINSTEHYFMLKIVDKKMKKFKDFSMTFSSSLLRMLPGVESLLIEPEDSHVTSIVLQLKDTLMKEITRLQTAWFTRASFLFPLYQDFRDEKVVHTHINYETMTELQLAFVLNSKKALVEIKMPPEYPAKDPAVTLWLTSKDPASKIRKFDMKSDFSPKAFRNVDLFHQELQNTLKEYTTF